MRDRDLMILIMVFGIGIIIGGIGVLFFQPEHTCIECDCPDYMFTSESNENRSFISSWSDHTNFRLFVSDKYISFGFDDWHNLNKSYEVSVHFGRNTSKALMYDYECLNNINVVVNPNWDGSECWVEANGTIQRERRWEEWEKDRY